MGRRRPYPTAEGCVAGELNPNHHHRSHSSFPRPHSTKGFEPATESKYRTFIKQLRAFTDSHGYVYIDQLAITDMDRFYASWQDGKEPRPGSFTS